MSLSMAKRVMADLKEINAQTFEDAPQIYAVLEDLEPPSNPPTNNANSARQPESTHHPKITALVVGPPGTPYANAMLLFRIIIDNAYPNHCPTVKCLSTDGGTIRLNPNLYSNGKVCLSILGTWGGESHESWRSTYSVLYILRCLQSMVLTEAPFFNEPGFEKEMYRVSYGPHSIEYSKKIAHESLRIGVCIVLEDVYGIEPPVVPASLGPPIASADEGTGSDTAAPATPLMGTPLTTAEGAENGLTPSQTPTATTYGNPSTGPLSSTMATGLFPAVQLESLSHVDAGGALLSLQKNSAKTAALHFAPIIKRQFHMLYESYLSSATDPEKRRLDGQPFLRMPFESPAQGNNCCGVFQYENLAERLKLIYAAMEDEEQRWRREGEEETRNHGFNAGVMLNEVEALRSMVGLVAAEPLPTNLFVWRFTFMMPSLSKYASYLSQQASNTTSWRSFMNFDPSEQYDLYEQSMFSAECVFSPLSPEEPPRVRFLQPIFHPNVSPLRGVPFYFARESHIPPSRRYLPSSIALMLVELLSCPPLNSETTFLNPSAAALCFSKDEAERKTYRRTAIQHGERTMEF